MNMNSFIKFDHTLVALRESCVLRLDPYTHLCGLCELEHVMIEAISLPL